LIHTQLIFNVLNTRTTESLNAQEALSTVLERFNRNSQNLNASRIPVRGFSWSRAFWDGNLSSLTNLLRLGRTFTFWGSSLITILYSTYYGFPTVRRILINRDLLLRDSTENITSIIPNQQTSSLIFSSETLQTLQNFFYDFATQFPRYFQF